LKSDDVSDWPLPHKIPSCAPGGKHGKISKITKRCNRDQVSYGYILFMHFCDSNHEIMQMQQEKE